MGRVGVTAPVDVPHRGDGGGDNKVIIVFFNLQLAKFAQVKANPCWQVEACGCTSLEMIADDDDLVSVIDVDGTGWKGKLPFTLILL